MFLHLLLILNFLSTFQLSEIHELMVEAAKILNIEAPDLYIRQNPVPNAYTLAISGRKPFVVVHTSLVELLTRRELQVCLPFNADILFWVYHCFFFFPSLVFYSFLSLYDYCCLAF
uniref:Peptidase M48 domain-containing protein n=1 Tax=Nelumbo nucifera TaxID=4432 RepID=A0A822YH26_NELNU|nr:TPA_asm: hypothetical protein HUJ06_009430 [Nelumbo nucifera]